MSTESKPVPHASAASTKSKSAASRNTDRLRRHPALARKSRNQGCLRLARRRDHAVLRRAHVVDTTIRHILVRHEQGAGHAAEGYASSSGQIGVCIATSGPGATNLVTAIADAHMDSVPLLAITGQVFSTSMGTDAFQEVDIVGITMPITKHSFLVTKPEDVPATIAAAYLIATTGRPGPVLVDMTKDAQQNRAPFIWPPKVDLPGYHPVTKAHGKQIQAAAHLLAKAKRPVFYVGGGVIRAGASAELLELAEATGAPVVTTLMARGAFPDSHRQHLGHARHARHRARRARHPGIRFADLARRPLRRPGDRQGERVRAERQSRSCRHRSRRDLQDPHGRCSHRRRCQGCHRRSHRRLCGGDQAAQAGHHRMVDERSITC